VEAPPVPAPPAPARVRGLHLALLASGVLALVVSGVSPRDRVVWWAETLPASVGFLLLALTYRRFRWTTISYVAVWVFSLVLILGGHYTYSLVPPGLWIQDAFDLARNPYDRIGHVLQGVIPALLARELLVRTTPLRPGGWVSFLGVCVALAVSATYELVEWGFAVGFGGDQAAAFLGTQGDEWDAQADMAMALLGAVAALLLLARPQQRQIDALSS
jgi:putative membrane protein